MLPPTIALTIRDEIAMEQPSYMMICNATKHCLAQFICVNPGLLAAQFDSFDSDADAIAPIEDEYHVCSPVLAICMPASSVNPLASPIPIV